MTNNINHIFEVADVTDDEIYYPLGLYLSLKDAEYAVNSRQPCDWNTNGYIDDRAIIEIRDRLIGWSGEMGITVFKRSYTYVYNETTDDSFWEIDRGESL